MSNDTFKKAMFKSGYVCGKSEIKADGNRILVKGYDGMWRQSRMGESGYPYIPTPDGGEMRFDGDFGALLAALAA